MVRILHVVTTMDLGGVETLLMNIYRNIDREKIQFDFLCMNTCDNFFSDEIKSLGGKMYAIPFISKAGYSGYKRKLLAFFKAHPEYQIVHTHIYAYNGIVLEQAKKAGVKVRIEHSHAVYTINNNIAIRTVNAIGKNKIEKVATHYFSCSEDVRDSFYNNKENRENCVVLKNVINVEKFLFHPQNRTQIRELYNAEQKFVLGQVGRFDTNKNQIFSIHLFERFHKKHPESVLWLIGDGPQLEPLKAYVAEKGLGDCILFLGTQDDVPKFMCGMDVLLFPSQKEGFGIVAIEAQCTGLSVLASDTIPRETGLTDLIKYISLENEDEWFMQLKNIAHRNMGNREIYADSIIKSGYDVKDVAKRLQEFYLGFYNH